MNAFSRRDGRLFAEAVDVAGIAETVGTPCYVYSRAAIEQAWRGYDQAFAIHPHLICYAVKANSNLAVLDILARLGSGFDIVSVGELERVLVAGGDPSKIVFAGVGKRPDEMRRALDAGIRCFNVESEAELLALQGVAQQAGVHAPVSLRVNPDVDANTHPYISTGLKQNKFGVATRDARRLYGLASNLSNLKVVGVGCHIGSQLTAADPVLDAIDRLLDLIAGLQADGISISQVDIGGGMGIRYCDEQPPTTADYAAGVLGKLAAMPYEIVMEPGRSIVGNAGILVTRVEYLKQGADRRFAIVDAAMNDLIRPALYSAWQDIVPVIECDADCVAYDVVGPICESGDFLGKDRDLRTKPGELLAVMSAGAYGFTMASNYNSRPRPVEVMVDGDHMHIIGSRESLADLWSRETILPR